MIRNKFSFFVVKGVAKGSVLGIDYFFKTPLLPAAGAVNYPGA
jgi:hypothetical protein